MSESLLSRHSWRLIQLLVCESTHRHRSGPQEVKVCVFPEQVTLRMGGVKLLSAHDEMAGEVAPCT